MTLNKEVLVLFENNQYDEALHLFEEAVKVERHSREVYIEK